MKEKQLNFIVEAINKKQTELGNSYLPGFRAGIDCLAKLIYDIGIINSNERAVIEESAR